ncbi:metallophosphoesterase family protein [Cellulomonas sp.]|uniref:metallophosphoesterase family protein n=1 Tax=Cellulomonas sp. TaxID=40001 RepID=UPI002D7133B4|nr:metallophosphoesterase family protein [Cellulomonas sp.]HYQ76441.1 metallophosphoesterase family protein [Cellulomonas sp.]
MKIALFSDTHGNALALEAVLRHAEAIGVQQYLNLGDMVGYYTQPREVVELARALPGAAVQGNHERFLARVLAGDLPLGDLTARYGEGHRIALDELGAEDLDWLLRLPPERVVELDGVTIRMCHGAPGEPDRYVYPDTSAEDLAALCDDACDYVVMGHTHYPYTFTHGACTLLNVGSVGQSKDVGGLATWTVLDTRNRTTVLMRTPYDLDRLAEEVRRVPNSNEGYLLSVVSRHRQDGR